MQEFLMLLKKCGVKSFHIEFHDSSKSSDIGDLGETEYSEIEGSGILEEPEEKKEPEIPEEMLNAVY